MTVMIGTVLDGPATRLQAGQALQRMRLTAAVGGVPVRAVPSALCSAVDRQAMRRLVGGGLWPQAVLLLG